MKKPYLSFLIIGCFIIIGLLFLKGQSQKTSEIDFLKTGNMQNKKRVVMIVAFRNFRDAEYFIPKEILEKAGVEIKTASNKKGVAVGADGGDVNVDLLVSEINVAEFDGVIFIGGPGCLSALDNEDSYRLIRETVSQNKILAAICISPVILAKAGVLEGKRATVWSSPLDKTGIKILQEKGSIYQENSVVVDGKIITANGPQSAEAFGNKILEVLNQ